MTRLEWLANIRTSLWNFTQNSEHTSEYNTVPGTGWSVVVGSLRSTLRTRDTEIIVTDTNAVAQYSTLCCHMICECVRLYESRLDHLIASPEIRWICTYLWSPRCDCTPRGFILPEGALLTRTCSLPHFVQRERCLRRQSRPTWP